jgi:hypothetical protein
MIDPDAEILMSSGVIQGLFRLHLAVKSRIRTRYGVRNHTSVIFFFFPSLSSLLFKTYPEREGKPGASGFGENGSQRGAKGGKRKQNGSEKAWVDWRAPVGERRRSGPLVVDWVGVGGGNYVCRT